MIRFPLFRSFNVVEILNNHESRKLSESEHEFIATLTKRAIEISKRRESKKCNYLGDFAAPPPLPSNPSKPRHDPDRSRYWRERGGSFALQFACCEVATPDNPPKIEVHTLASIEQCEELRPSGRFWTPLLVEISP